MEKAISISSLTRRSSSFKPRMPPIKSIRLIGSWNHRCQVPVLTAGPVKWKHPDPLPGQRSCTEEVPLKHTRLLSKYMPKVPFQLEHMVFSNFFQFKIFLLQPQRTAPYSARLSPSLHGCMEGSSVPHLGIKQTGSS